MNKFTIKSVLSMLLLMVGVSAWAQQYTLDATLDSNKGTNNSYAGNCDVTVEGITWNVSGNSTMAPWRIGGKSINEVDRTVYSKTAYPNELSKVSMSIGTSSAIINSISLQYSTASDFSNPTTIVAENTTANTTYDFEPEGGFPANAYYKFVFNVTVSGTSNKFIEFKGVQFFEKGGIVKQEATISANYKQNLLIDDEDDYTVTYNGDGELSITSSDENVAEAIIVGNDVLVSAVGKGTTTITITASETANCKGTQISYTLSVSDKPADGESVLNWSASVLGTSTITNSTSWSQNLDAVITAFFDAPEKATKPGYNKDGSVRLYSGGGFMTLSAKEGYTITNVELICNTGKTGYNVTTSAGEITFDGDNGTWEGITPVITITNNANSANNIQLQIKVINITYVSLTELDEVTVTSAGYATYVAPMNMIIGDGTVAKYITGVAENGTTLTLEDAAVVAGNEAVLLVGEGTHKVYGSSKLTATKNASNKLVAADNAPVGSYVLQSQSGVVGFYQVEGEAKSTNGHAYLDLGSTSVKAFNLSTIATGIQQLNTTNSNVTYDLMGRRVSNAQKGIFIVNGKKVIK